MDKKPAKFVVPARRQTVEPQPVNPSSAASSEGAQDGLTFRAELLRPVPSQLELAHDEVTRVVEQLDERARDLGKALGVSMTTFEINPVAIPETLAKADQSSKALYEAFATLTRSQEVVTLEKRDGKWGLWYRHTPSPFVAAGRPATTVPLRDAPLEARMKFLHKSAEFFDAYLKRAQEGLGSPQQAAAAGMRALEMLNNIKPA